MKRAVLLSLLMGVMFCGCTDDVTDGYIVNGKACTSDDQCASKNCYEGKVCRTPNWGGSSKLDVGESCTSDSQCSSKSCHDGYCISAGTKTPNGEACTSNEQCESNNCYQGKVCRTPNWGGDSKLELGSVCSENDSCASNNCVANVCNPAGVMDAKTVNGKACTSNDQCATSNCYEGKVCRSVHWAGASNKVGNGEPCKTNDQCVSDNCYEGKVCRAPNWSGNVKLEIGDACTSNDQCASNYCHNNSFCEAKSNGGNGGSGGNGGGGSISTSDANNKYCDAMINVCEYTKVYRNYDGCVESMDVLRAIYPECSGKWDAAYKCIAAQSCNSITSYDSPLSNLSHYYTLSNWVPEACEALAEQYIKCAGL